MPSDNNQNKKLRFGVSGSGFMGKTYSEVITKYLGNAELAGIYGGSRAAQLSKDYQVKCFQSLSEMAESKDLDAVIVATPHALHAEQSLLAISHGKHVLIEKPMASSVADCDRIIKAAEDASVACGISFTQRSRKCNVVAKDILDSGELGRILMIHETHVAPEGIGGLPQWQGTSENLGVLFGHGIHCIDSIRWLTGSEVKTVYAKVGSITGKYPVEATSNVLMTLQNGTVTTLACSFETPKPGFPRSQFSVQITCEKGLIDLDAYGELRVSKAGQPFEVAAVQAPIDWQGKGFLDPVRLESYTLHLKEFISAAQSGTAPSPGGYDGRQAVAIALAAYESSQTGREIILS